MSGLKRVASMTNGYGRFVVLAVAVATLALLAGCSNNHVTSSSPTCPGNTGTFSKASLAAGTQWKYELSGFQPVPNSTTGAISPYREAGVFTVDGNGNITSGTDDFYQQGVGFATTSGITGNYSVTPNGTGTMTIVLPSIGNLTWAITMTGANAFYIIETDTFANAQGRAVQQNPAAFTTPSGTFAFRVHALGSVSGSSAIVGEMTSSGGSVTGGSADSLFGGVLTSNFAVTGSFAAPDSSGRGTATLSYGTGTLSFNYYVIDANTIDLFETDANNLALGRMEMQTAAGSTFTNASLSGPYAFGSKGDTNATGTGGANTVGAIVADGAGNITSGTYDFVQDGAASSVQSLVGTYSISANGRISVSLNPTGANPVSEVAYLVSPTRAFFLINDSTKVEDGTADQQLSTSFSNSNVNGQYAFVMGGFDPTDFVDRTGPMQADGAGHLTLAEVLNRTGNVTSPGCLTGTYSVSANGRVAATVPSLSSNLVFYIVSNNQAYLLQGDGGTEIFGGTAAQNGAVVDPPGAF